MLRKNISVRENWQTTVESQGLIFHTTKNKLYWDESAYYEFSEVEALLIQSSINELHQLCLTAVDYVVEKGLYDKLYIPDWFATRIEKSWKEKELGVYGRFDLAYVNKKFPPKLIEYNADTPTLLLESSVVQYHWLQDQFPDSDQFNKIHELLLNRWQEIHEKSPISKLHFTCLKDAREDFATTDYMRSVAEQAGIETSFTYISDIDFDQKSSAFLDNHDETITALFKLYPWEWLLLEKEGIYFKQSPIRVFEPAWMQILSNKAILPLLWDLFPKHPNLLPAYTRPDPLQRRYVKKPFFSREGSNIEIHNHRGDIEITTGPYHKGPFIYQANTYIANSDKNYAIVNGWVIGDEAAGIAIREEKTQITRDDSRFIPHIVV